MFETYCTAIDEVANEAVVDIKVCFNESIQTTKHKITIYLVNFILTFKMPLRFKDVCCSFLCGLTSDVLVSS